MLIVAWNRILFEADKYCQFRTPFVVLAPNLLGNVYVRFAHERLKQLHVSRNALVNVVGSLQLSCLRIRTPRLVVHELRVVLRTFPVWF